MKTTEPRASRGLEWAAIGFPLAAAFLLACPVTRLGDLFSWLQVAGLADDPYPQLRGTGILALCALGPALHVFSRKQQTRVQGLIPLLIAAACAFALSLFNAPTDTFAARASLVFSAGFLTIFLGAAQVGNSHRRLICFALPVLTVLLAGRALAGEVLEEGHLAGVLGNTGPLSQAALPGALAGALALSRGAGKKRILCGLAVLLFAVHAGRAPVLAGSSAFAIAALVAFACKPSERKLLGLVALLVLAFAFVPRINTASDPTTEVVPETAVDVGDLSGVSVRAKLWSRVPTILAAHPLGLGPGQFQATFPPFRSADERQLSDRGAGVTTEVEHIHSDPLQALVELGFLGGAAWILFLALAGLASIRALRDEEQNDLRACLAIALLGLLINGLVHTPLTIQPISGLLGALLLGSLLASPSKALSAKASVIQRCLPLLTLLAAPFAYSLVAHGEALTDYVRAVRTIDERLNEVADRLDPNDGVLRQASFDIKSALERALEAAPDSVPALVLQARLTRQAPSDARLSAWQEVLERRPYHWEALVSISAAHAERGAQELADEHLERARILAPER